MFARGVVVADQVNVFIRWRALVDKAQKSQPLSMAMALGALAKYLARKTLRKSLRIVDTLN
jgi:hypothetical protein